MASPTPMARSWSSSVVSPWPAVASSLSCISRRARGPQPRPGEQDATLSANPGLATSLAHTFTLTRNVGRARRGLRDGGSQHPVGQHRRTPCGLGDVQEARGSSVPTVTPAHERLETDHVTVKRTTAKCSNWSVWMACRSSA